jgi:2-iminobutanoate/2-iminopropanoate deaminase
MRKIFLPLALLAGIAALLFSGQDYFRSIGGIEAEGATRLHIMLKGRSDSLPYSNGVLVGNTLYVAGTIGTDPATDNAPADLDREIHLALDSMKATLAEAGMTMDDLVSVQVFCPDLSLYDKFNATYRTYFKEKFPARAFIGSGSLLRGGHFEIQGIAVRD